MGNLVIVHGLPAIYYLFGTKVFHRSMVSRDLWLIGGGGGVCLHWCSGLPLIYGQLEEGWEIYYQLKEGGGVNMP